MISIKCSGYLTYPTLISGYVILKIYRVRPDFKGRYIVGSGSRHGPDSSTRQQEPNVKLVTPVAQAIEMAKSELKREKEDAAHIFPKSIRKPQSRPPGKVYYKPRAKKPKFDTQFDN